MGNRSDSDRKTTYKTYTNDHQNEVRQTEPDCEACRSTAHVKPLSNQETLNKVDKQILQEVWSELKRFRPDFMKEVWFNALKRGYKIKEIFDLQTKCEGLEILESEKVQRATWGVQRLFEEMIVEYKLDFDLICQVAADMGARHANYYKHGIQPTYWDIFALSLVDEYEKLCDNSEDHKRSVVVWRKFINLIIDVAAESYHLAITDPKAERDDEEDV